MTFFVLKGVERKNIIISEGNRPIWQLIIAAIFYTASLYFLYLFFIKIDLYAESKAVKNAASALEAAVIVFMGGLGFSSTKDFYFDFQNKQYRTVFRVGPIKIGKWQAFKSLNYVSVFKNGKEEFEVNLWYDRNKHFHISLFGDREEAIWEGKQLADQLKLRLLDATEANNQKWITLN